MLERLATKLTYANTMATIALFVALGSGGAYAAATIGADDIERNAVRSKHIKNNRVTGADVKESSLGQVPKARTVGGVTVKAIRVGQPAGAAQATVLSEGGLNVRMRCDGLSNVTVVPALGVGRASMVGVLPGTLSGFANDIPWDVGGGINGVGGGGVLTNQGIGKAVVAGPGGLVTSLEFAYYELTNGFGTTNDCFLRGILSTTNP